MIQFENNTERGFFEFLLGRGYARSTAADYIRRLRRIKSLDVLKGENLDGYINDYENGANENLNKRAHNAHSCALKRFKEYVG